VGLVGDGIAPANVGKTTGDKDLEKNVEKKSDEKTVEKKSTMEELLDEMRRREGFGRLLKLLRYWMLRGERSFLNVLLRIEAGIQRGRRGNSDMTGWEMDLRAGVCCIWRTSLSLLEENRRVGCF
jgi:hypothetical protein